ncbi:MAG: hypothetical protein IAB88_03260 [Bacteroidetes bacterium]|uniref:Chromosome partition protein Smc n=1 Tax=Candidatus Limisoma faecipullorum TaxID=2840854 RepID=A0A9D9IN58_9BACT|nr:hypothetical protein [Candidatus Limisoma faecipullorum]
MKRVFFVAGLIAVFAVSCSDGKTDNAADEAAQDSIRIETLETEKDSLMSLMGEISNNLIEINGLENIVTSKEFKSESPSRKREILNNIEAIKQELAVRRQKLEQLEEKLKKQNGYTANLQKTIDSQKQLIDQQNKKITDLEDELAKANIKIEDLNVRVDSLNTEVSNVSKEKQIAEQKTEELTNQLNTCYYIVETNKVLKEKKILEKRFLGRTKIMEGDFDRSAFVKADKRSLTEIPTGSTSAKVVSKQPADSYEIVDENGYKVVKITNANLFWEKSDFLVIEVK